MLEAQHALDAARAHVESYDGMSQSLQALFKALMPCGKVAYPEISTTGGTEFKAYRRGCTEGNCRHSKLDWPQPTPSLPLQLTLSLPPAYPWPFPLTDGDLARLWGGETACGWDNVFGADCPVESNKERCSWQGWEQRLRGVNDEGKPSYSPEFIPMHGMRMEMLKELRAKVKKLMPHHARDVMVSHAARVFDDRRSGQASTSTSSTWTSSSPSTSRLALSPVRAHSMSSR